MSSFPQYACPYALALAKRSPRFALQVFEDPGEDSAPDDGFPSDPFGELDDKCTPKGLKRRFPDRVLMMTSDKCFMNCRHCTRRGILGRSPVVDTDDALRECIEYVKGDSRIRDVLLSGGDILTLDDDRVMWSVDAFAALPQIDIVRVCTRALCANPARVTARLAKMLGEPKKVWVNTQFNCADELTPEAVAAAARLVDCGIPVSCQTVLLKGVNDSVEEMLKLFRALTAARIRPYYVFTCDPVAGIERFRVSREEARRIEDECAARIGGLSLPRFVSDIPGAPRKTPV